MNENEPLNMVSAEYRQLIETASFDWLVSTYIVTMDRVERHSSNEVVAAAIWQHGTAEHGGAFATAVANYRGGE